MNRVELSVVIVNYKSWNYLESCIQSFKDFPPKISYEIVVVDNDSRDGKLEEFAEKHPDIKLIKNKGNYGFSNGCNLGANNSVGEYLLFLNPDTTLTEDKAIDKMLSFSKLNLDVGIVSCRTVNPNKIERELLFSNPWLFISFARQLYKLINRKRIKAKFPEEAHVWYPDWVSGSVVFIKKDLFVKVGQWREERFWMYHEDPDLCMKVKRVGKKIALLRDVTIKHIGGGTSRQNLKSTVLAKTEVVISSHNYFQVNTKTLKPLLHFLFGVTNLIALLIKACFSLFILNFFKVRVYLLTSISIIKYYFLAIFRGTWKSPKLDQIIKQ